MSSKKQSLLGIIALFFCVFYTTACAQLNQDRLRYIEKYKDIAVSEMERAGVPASIKLAQAILESNSGKSTLANKANNHFGMKCGYGWEGKTFYREDDDYDPQGNLIKSCFRVFKDPDASFVAHSEFLRDPRKNGRYGFLFRLDPLDYKRWALGLKKAGYATNPRYPDLLIKIIEEYELYLFDTMDDTSILVDAGERPDIIQPNVVAINGASVAIAQAGETIQDISVRTSIPADRILKYNERLNSPSKELEEDYKVYLQPKRWSFRGQRRDHYVQSGETMFSISQKYGVRLKNLYSKNRLEFGREPAVGEKIRIRGFKISKKDAPRVKRKGEKDDAPITIPIRDNDKDPEIIEFDKEAGETDIDDFDGPRPNSDRPDMTNNGNDNTDIILDDPDDKPISNNGEIPQTDIPDDPDVTNTDDGLPDGYYIVQDGDTLYRIARKYNMSVPDLKRINNLKSNIIQIGQRLNLQ